MRPKIDVTYITNTLAYIHLLPLNEQIKHINKILHYFDINSKRNNSSTTHYKLIKKTISLINKNKNVPAQFYTK